MNKSDTPDKKLAEATERLKQRNDRLEAHLGLKAKPPETTLDDATERARKFWDRLEKKR